MNLHVKIESRKHDCRASAYSICDLCEDLATARKILADYGVESAATAEIGDEMTVNDEYDYRVSVAD